MTLKCKWHIKMKLQYVDNTVGSLLMELLTLQMLAEELSSSVKWETLMEIEDILYLNPSSTLLLSSVLISESVYAIYFNITWGMSKIWARYFNTRFGIQFFWLYCCDYTFWSPREWGGGETKNKNKKQTNKHTHKKALVLTCPYLRFPTCKTDLI